MPGIIGENHALRTVVYTMADSMYRRMVASYNTELDGLLPPPLGLIMLQHDVGNFGQGGDVADWDVGTLTISTTEPLNWELFSTHYIRLMKPTGELTASIAVTQGATDHEAVLASSPGFTPLFDDAGRERTRYVFGPSTNMGALAKVRAIIPRGEREVEHRVVLEDNRVHLADQYWLPSGAQQDPPATGNEVDPGGNSGSAHIVNLINFDTYWPYSESAIYTPSHTHKVYNDGRLSWQTQEVGETFFGGGQWLTPQTVTTDISGLYEVRFTVVQLIQLDTVGGDAPDVWHNLATTREIVVSNSAPHNVSSASHIVVEIRLISTGVIQGSARYIFQDDIYFTPL